MSRFIAGKIKGQKEKKKVDKKRKRITYKKDGRVNIFKPFGICEWDTDVKNLS